MNKKTGIKELTKVVCERLDALIKKEKEMKANGTFYITANDPLIGVVGKEHGGRTRSVSSTQGSKETLGSNKGEPMQKVSMKDLESMAGKIMADVKPEIDELRADIATLKKFSTGMPSGVLGHITVDKFDEIECCDVMTIHFGEEVKVGKGIIYPANVHGVPMERGYMKIQVDTVYPGWEGLKVPRPTDKVMLLGDATKDAQFILWPKNYLKVVPRMSLSLDNPQLCDPNISSTPLHHLSTVSSPPLNHPATSSCQPFYTPTTTSSPPCYHPTMSSSPPYPPSMSAPNCDLPPSMSAPNCDLQPEPDVQLEEQLSSEVTMSQGAPKKNPSKKLTPKQKNIPNTSSSPLFHHLSSAPLNHPTTSSIQPFCTPTTTSSPCYHPTMSSSPPCPSTMSEPNGEPDLQVEEQLPSEVTMSQGAPKKNPSKRKTSPKEKSPRKQRRKRNHTVLPQKESSTIEKYLKAIERRPMKIRQIAEKFINKPKSGDFIVVRALEGLYEESYFDNIFYDSVVGWMSNDWPDGTILHWWGMHLYQLVQKGPKGNKCGILNPSEIDFRLCRTHSHKVVKHIESTLRVQRDKTIFVAPYLQCGHWVLFVICPLMKTGYILDSANRDFKNDPSIYSLEGHVKPVLGICFSPNGYHLATGGEDNTCKIWDIRKKGCLYTIPAHTKLISQIKFEPQEGHFLVTASHDKTAKVWSSRDFKPVKVLSGHESRVTSVDVVADGQSIGTISHDRTIKLWSSKRQNDMDVD